MKLSNREKAIATYNAIQDKRKEVAKSEKMKENEVYNYTKATIDRIRRLH